MINRINFTINHPDSPDRSPVLELFYDGERDREVFVLSYWSNKGGLPDFPKTGDPTLFVGENGFVEDIVDAVTVPEEMTSRAIAERTRESIQRERDAHDQELTRQWEEDSGDPLEMLEPTRDMKKTLKRPEGLHGGGMENYCAEVSRDGTVSIWKDLHDDPYYQAGYAVVYRDRVVYNALDLDDARRVAVTCAPDLYEILAGKLGWTNYSGEES